MEQKPGRVPTMAAAAVLAAAGFGLRMHQLATGFEYAADGARRMVPGTAMGFFTWFTVAVVLAFAVFAWTRRGRKKFSSLGPVKLPEALVACGAALLLALGCAAMVISPDTSTERYLGLGGLASAVCWFGSAAMRYRGKKPSVYLYLVPVLFFAMLLLVNFRVWSRDPEILDYCYDLFAMISAMIGLFYLSGYCLDQGCRRMAVFFLLCSLFFCAVSMVDARMRHVLIMGGVWLWLALHLWQILRPLKKEA